MKFCIEMNDRMEFNAVFAFANVMFQSTFFFVHQMNDIANIQKCCFNLLILSQSKFNNIMTLYLIYSLLSYQYEIARFQLLISLDLKDWPIFIFCDCY